MFLGCAACTTEIVVDHAPFLPIWALCCAIWACSLQKSEKPPVWVLTGVALCGIFLAVSPLSVLVLALVVLAWPLWLGATAMRRLDSRAWLSVLVVAVPVAIWGWNTPQMLVQRLGSGRMAQDASYEILRRASAGENMVPYLTRGLQGEGNYWIQSSADERRANIIALLPAFRDRSAIPVATEALARGNPFTTEQAIACLESLGGQDAAMAIVDHAASHPHDVERSIIALRHLTSQNFGEDWPRWRAWLRAHPLEAPVRR